ncbi:MAG: hypothetical protein ACJAVI_005759 [Candidatus Azotimanducaceae bacterium]|jgi:hypothetical protein
MSTKDKWEGEKRAVKAVQIAFDVGDDVNRKIRLEAVQRGINPPDRVRQILGLPVTPKPVRPRLSISLSDDDFVLLAEEFGVAVDDKLKIRQLAAEKLIEHLESEDG